MMDKKDILIESRCGIGDLFQMIVVFRNVRIKWPSCNITLVTSQKESANILMQMKIIDNYVSFGNIKQEGIIRISKEIINIAQRHFDIGIIDPTSNQNRWKAIMKICGCKTIFCTDYGRNKKNKVWALKRKYYVLLQSNGIPIIDESSVCTQSEYSRIEKVVNNGYLEAVCNKNKLIGVCIRESFGSREQEYNITEEQEFIRFIPMNKVVSLINQITRDGYFVALLGGLDDINIVKEYYHKFVDEKQIINLVGKLDLTELLCFMKSCELVIGGDCGLVHMADFIGTKTMIYYGSTSPDYIGPFSARTFSVVAHQECQFCFHKIRPCLCKDKKYLLEITTQMLYDEFLKIMNK